MLYEVYFEATFQAYCTFLATDFIAWIFMQVCRLQGPVNATPSDQERGKVVVSDTNETNEIRLS